jgi:hypothetical protein
VVEVDVPFDAALFRVGYDAAMRASVSASEARRSRPPLQLLPGGARPGNGVEDDAARNVSGARTMTIGVARGVRYIDGMRTEFDIPAELLTEAETLARKLGLSLSALHAAALEEFVRRHSTAVRHVGTPPADAAEAAGATDLEDVSFSRVEYRE